MIVQCPKCGFSQPSDSYCAKCGIDMTKVKPPKKSWIESLTNSIFFHISLFLCILIGTYIFVRQQDKPLIQDPTFQQKLQVAQEKIPSSRNTEDNTFQKQRPQTVDSQKKISKVLTTTASPPQIAQKKSNFTDTDSKRAANFFSKQKTLYIQFAEVSSKELTDSKDFKKTVSTGSGLNSYSLNPPNTLRSLKQILSSLEIFVDSLSQPLTFNKNQNNNFQVLLGEFPDSDTLDAGTSNEGLIANFRLKKQNSSIIVNFHFNLSIDTQEGRFKSSHSGSLKLSEDSQVIVIKKILPRIQLSKNSLLNRTNSPLAFLQTPQEFNEFIIIIAVQ